MKSEEEVEEEDKIIGEDDKDEDEVEVDGEGDAGKELIDRHL